MKKYRIDFFYTDDNFIVESHKTNIKKNLLSFYKKFFETNEESEFRQDNCDFKVYQDGEDITNNFIDYMLDKYFSGNIFIERSNEYYEKLFESWEF